MSSSRSAAWSGRQSGLTPGCCSHEGELVGAYCRRATIGRSGRKWRPRARKRNLNLAIDRRLGANVVAIRIDDVAPSGYSMDRVAIRQKQTERPAWFELTNQTRQAIDIRRSRAPCATSASRSMVPSQSRRRSASGPRSRYSRDRTWSASLHAAPIAGCPMSPNGIERRRRFDS